MERVELAMDFERREDAEAAYRLLKQAYESIAEGLTPPVGSHCFLRPTHPPADLELKAA
jgi:hypothetical protein